MDSIDLHLLLGSESWQSLFDRKTLARAAQYATEQRVLALGHERANANSMILAAQVRGSERQPYRCQIGVQKSERKVVIGGSCTCPVGFNCKHVAAALLVASTVSPAHWPGQSVAMPPAQPRPLQPAGAGAPPWQRWLDRLRAATEPVRSGDMAKREQAFALFLHSNENTASRALLLSPVWLSPGKSKPWVSPRNLNVGPHGPTPVPEGGWPEEVLDALMLLLRDCSAYRSGSLSWLRLTTAYHERAFSVLAQRYPMYVDRAGREPLQQGPTLALNLRWHAHVDGSQQLVAEVGNDLHMRILRAEHLWYLDQAGNRFGRVDGDPAVLDALGSAPVLQAEEVADFNRLVDQRSLPIAVPKAVERGPVRRVEAQPAELVLVMRQVDTGYTYARRRVDDDIVIPERIAVGRVEFDYGGVRVPRDAPALARQLVDGELVEVQRDLVAEMRTALVLDEFELTEFELVQHDYDLDDLPIAPDELIHEPFIGHGLASPQDLQAILAELIERGVRIEYEGDFPRQRLVEASDWYADIESSGNAWFDLRLGIDLDGERVDLLPILRRLLADPTFPLRPGANGEAEAPDATWSVAVDDERRVRLPLARLRELVAPLLEWLEGDQGDHLRLHRSQAENLARLADASPRPWRGDEVLRGQLQRLRQAAGAEPELPAGFQGELRGYQRDGLAWLNFLDRAGLGGVLADDMGLGKTVQVLAHLLSIKREGRLQQPALIVCPTSLVGNWRDEAARFTPELRCLVLHGADRGDRYDEIADHDLIITTYPLLPRDRDRLVAQRFGLLVLDEAQAVKNARSQAAQVVREIPTERRLAMTGTPLENHLGELWAQFDAVEPGLLGGERQFNRLYRGPIEKRGDGDRRERLSRRIGPLLLRRRKEEVLSDLPAKTEILRHLDLEGDQRALYETLRLTQHERVRQVVEQRGLSQAGIVVLDALLKLRQACCDPRLVKLKSARQLKTSVKLEALIELVTGLVDEGRRILVFSQFAEMLALIEQAFSAEKIEYQTLTGQTPGGSRADLVRRFQDGKVPVFLISLKAGGVGLNLTAADTVIHYDPWWNPAVEAQATDRAHRIGQDKPVFVYKLICTGTVEEKIQALQARKAELAQAVLEGGSTQRLRFDESDLEALFAPL